MVFRRKAVVFAEKLYSQLFFTIKKTSLQIIFHIFARTTIHHKSK